jgi:hypothetical protein
VIPRPARPRPRQHLWDEAVLYLAQLGRAHLWRLTVGTDWMELRDETGWIQLRFLPEDQFLIRTGLEGADEAGNEHGTASYATALETVERLASRG